MKKIIQFTLTLLLSIHALFATAIEVSEITGSKSCNLGYTLPHNQWRQIVLPCDPGSNSSVAEVFGDDMTNTFTADSSSYTNNWIIFQYDSANNSYIELTENDTVKVGVGYWIIQQSGNIALLSLPPNSTPVSAVESAICPSGCFEIPLNATSGTQSWNMIGRPNRFSSKLEDVIIHANTTACSAGCDIDIAENNTLVHNQLWTYDGTSSYTLVSTSSGTVKPWTAYWAATLQNSEGTNPTLLFPKSQTSNILLNEVIASNKTILADPDNQKFGDWVELYNPGESSEDISGFHLTDDPQESPKKWKIPDGITIEAGGYLLIWADGKDKHEQAA